MSGFAQNSEAAYESVAFGVADYHSNNKCLSSTDTPWSEQDAITWDAKIVDYNAAYLGADAWKWLGDDYDVDGNDFRDVAFGGQG